MLCNLCHFAPKHFWFEAIDPTKDSSNHWKQQNEILCFFDHQVSLTEENWNSSSPQYAAGFPGKHVFFLSKWSSWTKLKQVDCDIWLDERKQRLASWRCRLVYADNSICLWEHRDHRAHEKCIFHTNTQWQFNLAMEAFSVAQSLMWADNQNHSRGRSAALRPLCGRRLMTRCPRKSSDRQCEENAGNASGYFPTPSHCWKQARLDIYNQHLQFGMWFVNVFLSKRNSGDNYFLEHRRRFVVNSRLRNELKL